MLTLILLSALEFESLVTSQQHDESRTKLSFHEMTGDATEQATKEDSASGNEPHPAPRPERVLVFHQEACPPCVVLLKEITKWNRADLRVGTTNECHVQIVDLANDPDGLAKQCGVQTTPAIALLQHGTWVRRQIVGGVNAATVRRYIALLPTDSD